MRKQLVADLILLGISALWGVTFVVVQNAIELLPPYSFIAIRFFIAFMVLLPFVLISRKSGRRTPVQEQSNLSKTGAIIAGIILGVWLFMGYAFQTIGLLYTTSSKAGFITGLSVVLVPLFTFFILGLRPKIPAVLGVGLAAIGLYYLTLGETLIPNKGDILVFFCAIGFALHIVLTGKYVHKFDALSLTVVQLGAVSLFSLIFALYFEGPKYLFSLDILLNPIVLLAILVTSIFATSFAFLAQTRLQRFTTPTRVALIFATEPVFAAITGVFFAGDILGAKAILGCILILAGMILAELPLESLAKIRRMKKLNNESIK